MQLSRAWIHRFQPLREVVIEGVLALALAALVFFQVIARPWGTFGDAKDPLATLGEYRWIIGAAFGVAGLIVVPLRRRWLWPLILLGLMSWLILHSPYHIAPGVYSFSVLQFPFYIALVFYTFAAQRARWYYWAVTLAGSYAVYAIGVLFFWPQSGSLSVAELQSLFWIIIFPFPIMLYMVIPALLGLGWRTRRELIINLRQQVSLAKHEAEWQAERSRAEERTRIAHEMHDVIAHRVSMMTLHAGAIEMHADSDIVQEEARIIQQSGTDALHELRHVLGVLRTPTETQLVPVPRLADLDQIISQSRDAGLDVTLSIEGTPRPVPAPVEHAVYRIMQEALTNVHKHAANARTEARITYQPTGLDITVRNARPPQQAGRSFPAGGHGIIGLRERIALLHGTLTAQPEADGGFRIAATLPTEETA